MPEAYKNLQDVVQVMHEAGIAKKVAKLKIACLHKRVIVDHSLVPQTDASCVES